VPETLVDSMLQALEDLQSVETAFSDLHRRYEKTKSVIETMKKVYMSCTRGQSLMLEVLQ